MANGLVATGTAIIDPLYALWLNFKYILPGLIAAIIVLIIGYFIALAIGHVIRVILEKIGLDNKLKEAKLTKSVGHTNLSRILGEITKWYIFILFLQVAVDLLHLGTLTIWLGRFVSWLPNVIASVLIFIFGLGLAHFVEMKMNEHSKMKGVSIGSQLLKWVIIIVVVVMALKQIGIEISLVENMVLLIVGAAVVGIALAFGISFGLGARKDAEETIKKLKKKHL